MIDINIIPINSLQSDSNCTYLQFLKVELITFLIHSVLVYMDNHVNVFTQ